MTEAGAQPECILVVDDDELLRWFVSESLRERGYSVSTAANAREALRYCSNAALALLDYELPDTDGLALAEILRARQPRCALVLMTAHCTPELRRRASERGVVSVLKKPFPLETLTAAVRDALGGGPPPRSPHLGPPAAGAGPDRGRP